MSDRHVIENIIAPFDIRLDGTRPFDVQVHDERMFKAVLSGGTMALGETYMAGWWDCEDLAETVSRLIAERSEIKPLSRGFTTLWLKSLLFNLQTGKRAYQVGTDHYDLGNNLYEAMLDPEMLYTSGVWDGADTLAASQELKIDRLCKQLDLKPGQRLLDVGCGWGGFMRHAARHYGVSCVGLTVSKEQAKLGREKSAGLPIEFVVEDYQLYEDDVGFDHAVSVEMIEAVGQKNFRTYFQKVHSLLKTGGCFAVQAIISPVVRPLPDPWIEKYIFPNGVLPSHPQIEVATRNLFDWQWIENIGPDYDPTLVAWWENFDQAYPALKANNPKYDERFYRMWRYYLLMCAGLYRARELHNWQILLSKRD